MSHVKPVKRNRSRCACGAKARLGQRNCLDCHAEANREYRERKAEQHRQDHSAHLAAIVKNIGAEQR